MGKRNEGGKKGEEMGIREDRSVGTVKEEKKKRQEW